MKKRIFLNPLPVRIWHWINAVGFIVLIVTGIQIRYSELVNLMSLELAVDIHNWTGFILIGNYFIWFAYYFLTLNIKVYIPPFHHPVELAKGVIRQARYYCYGLFIGEQNPHHSTLQHKFNPMQQQAYFAIMFLLIPLAIVTGLFLWDVTYFSKWIDFFGGIRIITTMHVLLFLFFTTFLIVHIYLASLGQTVTTHFKAMITGYEELEVEEGEKHDR